MCVVIFARFVKSFRRVKIYALTLYYCCPSTPPHPLSDESLLSSDLSIELSHHEEQLPSLSFQEDEDSVEEEDEELPSFLMQVYKSERE